MLNLKNKDGDRNRNESIRGAALLSNGFYVCVCVCMCDI